VRTASLDLTEEILREAYRDPANPNAPDRPPYLRPRGGRNFFLSWRLYGEKFSNLLEQSSTFEFELRLGRGSSIAEAKQSARRPIAFPELSTINSIAAGYHWERKM